MVCLKDWLAQNPTKAVALRLQFGTKRLALADGLFNELPRGQDILLVEGVVRHTPSLPQLYVPGEEIVSDGVTFFARSQFGLLTGYINQTVRVICRNRQLVVELVAD